MFQVYDWIPEVCLRTWMADSGYSGPWALLLGVWAEQSGMEGPQACRCWAFVGHRLANVIC